MCEGDRDLKLDNIKRLKRMKKRFLWELLNDIFFNNLDNVMDALIIYTSGKAVGMTTDELKNLYYAYRTSLSSRDESIFLLFKHLSLKTRISVLKFIKMIVNILHKILSCEYNLYVSKRRLNRIILYYLKYDKND